MSPSTSNVNAGPIELIPTLVAGVPCTFTIVAPKPTFNKLVVVIPAIYAFDEVNARNATITGIATIGFTTSANAFVTGVTTTSKLNVTGVGTVGFLTATNAFVSGVGTVGFLTASNAAVSGMTTTDLLHVGFGATMVKVQGTPATRVGINSIGPAFTLDVDGDINSTGTLRQAGTSVLTTASGDATALAIALG